jgi:iron complex transport system substrate-binding protein
MRVHLLLGNAVFCALLFFHLLKSLVMRFKANLLAAGLGLCGSVMFSCGGREFDSKELKNGRRSLELDDNFVPDVRHAKYYSIEQMQGWKQIVVHDPWVEDTLGFYALVPRGAALPADIPAGATLVAIPVKNVACLSVTQIGALNLLGVADLIIGASNPEQIYDTVIRAMYHAGRIKPIGRQMETSIERVVALNPDLLFKTGHDNVRNDDVRISGAGITIGYNVEWMEPDLISRAEWLKYNAAFFGLDRLADSLFNEIELRYNAALDLAAGVAERPKVLIGIDYKGVWHMSGADSYVARMILDAGGGFTPNGTRGSAPLNFEQVLLRHSNDDIWLNWMHRGITSCEVLGKANERYSLFKAFSSCNVYNHDARLNPAGGNDFWESGVSRPDLLMKDLVKIFHPHLLPDYEMVYWRKLPANEPDN